MRLLSTVMNATAILVAVSILSACNGAEAGSSSAKGDSKEATGKLAIHGPLELSFGKVGVSSRLAPEPFQTTLVLGVRWLGGGGEFVGALLDIDDLPADLEEAEFPLDGGEVSARINLLGSDPMASSPRFSVESGTLKIKLAKGVVSGTLSGEAEEISFDRASRRTVTFEAEFEGIPFVAKKK